MNIRTEMHPCPWGAEWYAFDDDSYEGEFGLSGFGKTEAEAIADLKEQLDAPFCPECQSGPGEPHSMHCSLEHGRC